MYAACLLNHDGSCVMGPGESGFDFQIIACNWLDPVQNICRCRRGGGGCLQKRTQAELIDYQPLCGEQLCLAATSQLSVSLQPLSRWTQKPLTSGFCHLWETICHHSWFSVQLGICSRHLSATSGSESLLPSSATWDLLSVSFKANLGHC